MVGKRITRIAVAALFLGAVPLLAQGSGRIQGRVARTDGTGLGGVTVVVSESGAVQITSADGSYNFEGVAAGSYTLSFGLGDYSTTELGVVVEGGGTATVDKSVDWDVSFAETITVFSASRRRERIVEAPAAVTSLSEEQIQRDGAHAQLPKLLEFTPGVDTTQSGLYDFNLNTRGFNSSLNRRLVVLIDGRDPSVPFLGSQEWTVASQYMNDLSSAELVRGPSSALYGANAFNGVLNLVTKQPRYSQGGEVRLSGGELSTFGGDLRFAGDIGADWYYKLTGSYIEGDDFAVSRTAATGVEYAGFCPPGQTVSNNCFIPERIRIPVDHNEVSFGNLRVDKYFGNGDFFTVEGGLGEAQAPAIQTGIGRVSLPSVDRDWYRTNYTARHFNALGYWGSRQGTDQTGLQSGVPNFLDEEKWALELQTNWDFADGKVRVVGGASYNEVEIDSRNRQGRQTLLFAPVESDSQAAYGQVDFDLGSRVKIVLAGRYDESSLHDSQFSPKAAVVLNLAREHSVRLSYNEAFQVGNYSELFLQADAAAPVNLAPIEGICALGGVSCGFASGPTRILAAGNSALEVEEVTSWEVGYSGIFGDKAFLTVDYYNSTLENFITDLLPNVGTALGRINPQFGPYAPPAALGEPFRTILLNTLRAALGNSFFILSNNFDGSPALVAVSYTNFGEVDTQGADLGLNVYVTPEWRINASYSWFDFDIQQSFAGDPLLPNAPENKYTVGVGYVGEKVDASLNYRWVEGFPWAVGTLFRGVVDDFSTADLVANYHINDHWGVGVNVTNVLDDEHFESFGGDLIGRRALGNVYFRW